MYATHRAIDVFFALEAGALKAENSTSVLVRLKSNSIKVRKNFSRVTPAPKPVPKKVDHRAECLEQELRPLVQEQLDREGFDWELIRGKLLLMRYEYELWKDSADTKFLLRFLIVESTCSADATHAQLIDQYQLEEQAMEMSFLWRGYAPKYWYMEVVEMLRKFMLTGLPLATASIPGASDSFLQQILGGLVIAVSSILYADCSPYRQKADHYLMLPTQLVLSVAMAGGTLLKVDGEAMDGTASILILTCCIPVLAVLIFALVYPDKVDRQFNKSPAQLLRSQLEPLLLAKGIKWIEVENLVDKITMEEVSQNLTNPMALLDMLLEGGGETGKKLCLALLKPVLTPIIEKTCQGVSWNQVHHQLQKLTIEELRAGLSEPIAFVETVLKGLLRTFGKQALIANLKPLLQETLHKNNLVWKDVQPILVTIDIVGALEAAAADPAAFLSRLSDLGGPVAFRLRIAMLKKPMVPVLARRGLAWQDVLPALQLVDSVGELKAAAADPAAFLLQHLVISGSGPSRCISFNISSPPPPIPIP